MSKVQQIKKIGFFSAILIIIGSTIGAGIFVKNSSLLSVTQGKITFIIAAWTIAAFAFISLGIALFEVGSVARGNKGIFEWTKNFLPRWMHKGSVGYIMLFYFPANYFMLPLFLIQELQSTFGVHLSGVEVGLIGFSICTWNVLIAGFSLRFGERLQWFLAFAKILPLAVLPLIGIAEHNGLAQWNDKSSPLIGLASVSPWVGLFATIPAISFAFDGFYQASSLRNDLKKPSLAPKALFVAISCVAIVYLFFSGIFLLTVKSGTYQGLNLSTGWMRFFQILIAMAIWGILNGFAIATPNSINSLWHSRDFWEPKWAKKFKDKRLAAAVFSWVTTIPFYVILVLIGQIYNPDGSAYSTHDYGSSAGVYALNDFFSNWATMVLFVIIIGTVFGTMINRFTRKVKVKKVKWFMFFATFGAGYVLLGFLYMFTEQIVNMTGFHHADVTSAVATFIILIFSLVLGFIPSVIEKIKYKGENRELSIGEAKDETLSDVEVLANTKEIERNHAEEI